MVKPAFSGAKGWCVAAAFVLLACGAYFAGGAEVDVPGPKPDLPQYRNNASSDTLIPLTNSSSTGRGQDEISPHGRPPSELDDLVQQSKLSEPWLISHGFSQGALQRLHALLDGRTELNAARHHSLIIKPFGATQDAGVGVPRLAPEERYLHASLAAGLAGGEDSVILRWRRLGDDEVIELSSQAMPAGPDEALQLWMHKTQDWSPGSYRLEVISANPYLELLAAAEFEIVSTGVPVTPFAFPVKQTQ